MRVLLATLASWLLDFEARGGAVVGGIPQGLPVPVVPEIDLSIIIRGNNLSPENIDLQVALDGTDVSEVFQDCAISHTLIDSIALTCPDLPISLLPAGQHNLQVSWSNGNFNIATDQVTWEILNTVQ